MTYDLVFDGKLEIAADWYSYDSETKVFCYGGRLIANNKNLINIRKNMLNNEYIREIKILDSNRKEKIIRGYGKIEEHKYDFDIKTASFSFRGLIFF